MSHNNYIKGFEKSAVVSSEVLRLAKDWTPKLPVVGGVFGLLGGSTVGAGIGMMSRARVEDKLKPKKERTMKDEVIAKLPGYGALAGAALGAGLGARAWKKHYQKPAEKYIEMADAFQKLTRKVDRAKEKGFDRWAKAPGSDPRSEKDFIQETMRALNIDPNQIQKSLEGIIKGFEKKSALKKEVVLRDHQRRALAKQDENDGNLLVAHATGSGKTLTGIAAFEKSREKDPKAKAIVVVPASLRENFAENGVKKFTDSSVKLYGPKNEKKSLNVGDKSNAAYNVISYELFREHGDKIMEDTGAKTLIMDEIHRVRGTEGSTYNKIRELRKKFDNAITLTGSIVNNNPNDVVPLLDITYKPEGHRLVNKKFFDKLFVRPEAKTYGYLNPKVHIEKKLKNKDQQ